MNAVRFFQLAYTGQAQPQHILQETKAAVIYGGLEHSDNVRLAEYFLRAADFDAARAEKTKA